MDLSQYLSKKDCPDLLEIISHGLTCRSQDDFQNLILDLQNLIAFECAVGGYFNTDDLFNSQEVPQEQLININFPDSLLNWYFAHGSHLADPVLVEFFKTFELQNWTDVTNRCLGGKKDIITTTIEEFGLKDGFTYGVRDFNLLNATCFFFAGEQVENNERTRAIIKYAVPHFSQILKRLVATKLARAKYQLTPKELEVLKWLKQGKSSWDISIILGRSERTMNFHVGNIVKKLDAMNRTHAVAIAVDNKLIDL